MEPEVGELVTSLDMGGVSLTLVWLDGELDELWHAPAYTPGYRKGGVAPVAAGAESADEEILERAHAVVAAEPASQDRARIAVRYLEAVRDVLHDNEELLGRIDAFAGDGDHGVGMRVGIDAAVAAADPVEGLAGMLAAAGDAWSDQAGGTSGALWGSVLRALGRALDTEDAPIGSAGTIALETVTGRGGATVGDKTMVDALDPFARVLAERSAAGDDVAEALYAAAEAATRAAEETASLRPKLGRARPLAEKSIGHPDAGATSLALIATTIAQTVFDNKENNA